MGSDPSPPLPRQNETRKDIVSKFYIICKEKAAYGVLTQGHSEASYPHTKRRILLGFRPLNFFFLTDLIWPIDPPLPDYEVLLWISIDVPVQQSFHPGYDTQQNQKIFLGSGTL
jgi:hypothetical protein